MAVEVIDLSGELTIIVEVTVCVRLSSKYLCMYPQTNAAFTLSQRRLLVVKGGDSRLPKVLRTNEG